KIFQLENQNLLYITNKNMGEKIIDDYVEEKSPYIYYRMERGIWHTPGFYDNLPSIVNNRGEKIKYVFRVNKQDVFNAFSMTSQMRGTGNPVRLFFNELTYTNVNNWLKNNRHTSNIVSIIKIVTSEEGILAENY